MNPTTRIIISILCAFCVNSGMQAMQPLQIDSLPADVLGVIAGHIPAPNSKVAVQKVKALSLANSRLLSALNSKNAIHHIATSFAHRFKTDPLAAAVELNTPGAHQWLTQRALENKDYTLFETAQTALKKSRTEYYTYELYNKIRDILEKNKKDKSQQLDSPLTLSLQPKVGPISSVIHNPCLYCKQGNCSIKCPLCKKAPYCSIDCQRSDWHCHAQNIHQNNITIDSVVPQCITLLKKLNERPHFDGEGSLADVCKVLPGDKKDRSACLCESLCRNARDIVGTQNAWYVQEYGSGNYQFHDKDRTILNPGLTMSLYKNTTPCSLEELENAFKTIIYEIKQGWTLSDIKNYADIFHKPDDPDDYYLFIKPESSLHAEESLVASLVALAGLSHNKIKVGNIWLDKQIISYEYRKDLYLFVKKDAIDAFKHVFNIKHESKL